MGSRPLRRPDTATLAAEIDALRAAVLRLGQIIEAHHTRLAPEQIAFIAAGSERARAVRWLRAAGHPDAAAALEAGAHDPTDPVI